MATKHQSVRYESDQEPIDEEERELMDPETWDWDNPIEGVTAGDRTTVLTIDLTRHNHRLLAKAARAEGMTTHEFIKQAALKAALGTVN